MADRKIRVTLVKSIINCSERHRATIRGLGLRRLRQTVELKDTAQVRGMINCVNYLVRLEG
jgi:large subunit ribosomal protein L30